MINIERDLIFPDMVGKQRIKLDLTDFVKDAGGQRWMFVSRDDFSTISDVVDRLREEHQQLGQHDIVTLFLDNFTLPPWESVELLQSGDLVKVCRTKAGCWRSLWRMVVGGGGDGGGRERRRKTAKISDGRERKRKTAKIVKQSDDKHM